MLKSGLPGGYRLLSMADVTKKIECAYRALAIKRKWCNQEEILLPETDWIGSDHVCQQFLRPGWIQTDRLDWLEDCGEQRKETHHVFDFARAEQGLL